MKWNWQQKDWPHFKYDKASLEGFDQTFFYQAGIFLGTEKHLDQENKNQFIVEIMSDEALKTSEIEGEYLNRETLQSSFRLHFNLAPIEEKKSKIPAAEKGISEMMYDLYQTFSEPLTHEKLFSWHRMLTKERKNLKAIGKYRTHEEPMQIVSGAIHTPKIHFEAPPSKEMGHQMEQFILWFNNSCPLGSSPLPTLIRAGIAHLYFVCIHPFEDANGRIARALSEKVLSQAIDHPILLSLSHTIENNKKDYYSSLSKSDKSNEITHWLNYFSNTVINAQIHTQQLIDFLISKTKFYDRIKDQLNPRQEKVIARMFAEGIKGFQGGLTAEKYIAISKASRASATRDLNDLVDKNVLTKTGSLKATRYYLIGFSHS